MKTNQKDQKRDGETGKNKPKLKDLESGADDPKGGKSKLEEERNYELATRRRR